MIRLSLTKITRRESYRKLDAKTINKRILSILQDGKERTAREVSVEMYKLNYIPFPVRQAVAPRLTELVGVGLIEVTGKTYDQESKRNVVTYRLVK